MSLFKHEVVQYAYVVKDIEAACRRWTELIGAGPFYLSMHHQSENVTYRGKPSDMDVSYAFGYCGPAHIQLVQQHNDAPSVYRDMFPGGGEGMHHIAYLIEDWEAEKARYEAAGYPSLQELVSAARVSYVDTRPAIGCFTELYEDNLQVRRRFAGWKASHEYWDGKTDPIRDIYAD
jgi:catechol 2,3-dioxygenase-like lactoylglutathione lyase family enzyme